MTTSVLQRRMFAYKKKCLVTDRGFASLGVTGGWRRRISYFFVAPLILRWR